MRKNMSGRFPIIKKAYKCKYIINLIIIEIKKYMYVITCDLLAYGQLLETE